MSLFRTDVLTSRARAHALVWYGRRLRYADASMDVLMAFGHASAERKQALLSFRLKRLERARQAELLDPDPVLA